MRQPAKCVLREQLALAADALIAERERAEYWRRTAMYANEPMEGNQCPHCGREMRRQDGQRWCRDSFCKGFVGVDTTPRVPWWRRLFRRAA
jgi:hypothetical protein